MMLADTDILSALAKIDRVSILYSLLQRTVLYITPGVFKEIEHSYTQRRQYAIDLFALLSSGHIEMTLLTPDEMAWKDTLPGTLGAGECESIAVAKARSGTVLSNGITCGALLPTTSRTLLTITRYFTSLMGGKRCTKT